MDCAKKTKDKYKQNIRDTCRRIKAPIDRTKGTQAEQVTNRRNKRHTQAEQLSHPQAGQLGHPQAEQLSHPQAEQKG